MPTPSPFPCVRDFIYSFSFARDEELGKSVREWVKPKTFLVDRQLGHRCLMRWCWCGVLVLGMVLGISGLMLGMVLGISAFMLGVSIGYWYWERYWVLILSLGPGTGDEHLVLVLVLGVGCWCWYRYGCWYWALIVVLAFGLPGLYIVRCSSALWSQNLGHVPLSPGPDVAALCREHRALCSPRIPGSCSGRCSFLAAGTVSREIRLHFNIVHLGLAINRLPRTGCIFHLQCIPGVLA